MTEWDNVRKVCDEDCKALVYLKDNYSTCTNFCAAQNGGLTCVGAWEEYSNTCRVKKPLTCDDVVRNTSDTICECAVPVLDSDGGNFSI